MSTLMGAVELLRDRGVLPANGTVCVKDLLKRFQLGPPGCVRPLLLTMFGSVSQKRPWSIILCRFKGELANSQIELQTEAFYRQVFTPGRGGMIEYWRDVSLGAIDVTGSQVFGWVEVDVARANAGIGSGVTRGTLIDYAISAAKRDGLDPVTGFHSQVAVYTENWTKPGAPPGANWQHPVWGQFWIDGSADGRGKVCLTPEHNGNVLAHEMGHGFGMGHDVGPDLNPDTSDYSDPCCIMSQNGPFIHPTWGRAFGPAICLPHLIQRDWMYKRRVYHDDGGWLSASDGITLPLAPISCPAARANLGIKLTYSTGWDYYLEYVIPTEWNRGVPGAPYVFIRRIVSTQYGNRPAYLGFIQVPAAVGTTAEFIEPSGNVRFQAELTNLPGPILAVSAKKL